MPGGGLCGFWCQKIDQNWNLEGVCTDSGSQARPVMRLVPVLCVSGANIGPTWDPRWHQVGVQIVRKSMSTSIKKLMPLEIDFFKDFSGFGEGKWSQLGTKIGSKINLDLKTLKIKKTHKNQWNFNDFWGSDGPSWDPKSIKNRYKKRCRNGRARESDF